MGAISLTPAQLQQAVDALAEYKTQLAAADALGVSRTTIQHRLKEAERRGVTPGGKAPPDVPEEVELRAKVRDLQAQVAAFHRETLDEKFVKQKIVGLAEQTPSPPEWLVRTPTTAHTSGVPTLFASDWHWGEVVSKSQVNGVNQYDMAIAQRRARAMIEIAIDLLNNHLTNPEYPGIVFALGGDMVSGDIHEELMATNEREIMPVVLDMFGVLVWCIESLADAFGNVFVPCVGGNHGRDTLKIRAKGRNFTSFDWLLYCFLAKHFENDKRVVFHIPDGPDAYYKIYNHRYLLTHGDQFRGGDGMIGALGPIIRGDHKKRSRNGQIDMSYDTLVIGHWHQLIQLQRLIVNGSLKGYDEYANSNNFGYESPKQALWITHPEHGITISMPVHVDRAESPVKSTSWISWPKG